MPKDARANLEDFIIEFERNLTKLHRFKAKKYNVAVIGMGDLGSNVAQRMSIFNEGINKLILSNRKSENSRRRIDLLSNSIYGLKIVEKGLDGIKNWISSEEVDLAIITLGEYNNDREAELIANSTIISQIAKSFEDYKGSTVIMTNPTEAIAYIFASVSKLNPYSITGFNHVDTIRGEKQFPPVLNMQMQLQLSEINLRVIGAHRKNQMIPYLCKTMIGLTSIVKHPLYRHDKQLYCMLKDILTKFGDDLYEMVENPDLKRGMQTLHREILQEFKNAKDKGETDYEEILASKYGKIAYDEFKRNLNRLSASSQAATVMAREVFNSAMRNEFSEVCMATWNPILSLYVGWPTKFKNLVSIPSELDLSFDPFCKEDFEWVCGNLRNDFARLKKENIHIEHPTHSMLPKNTENINELIAYSNAKFETLTKNLDKKSDLYKKYAKIYEDLKKKQSLPNYYCAELNSSLIEQYVIQPSEDDSFKEHLRSRKRPHTQSSIDINSTKQKFEDYIRKRKRSKGGI